MKRRFALLSALFLFLIFSIWGVSASGTFEYILLPDGSAEITGWTGEEAVLEIPAELDGHPVSKIGEYALAYGSVEKVIIPAGVIEILPMAFSGCFLLREVQLPESLRVIGADAFLCCEALTVVLLPDGLEEIGEEAFYNCTGLTVPVLPESLRSVGHWAFEGCVEEEK